MFLQELAEQTGGRYHCYVSTSDVSRCIKDYALLMAVIIVIMSNKTKNVTGHFLFLSNFYQFSTCVDPFQEQIMTGTDLSLIADEMKKAQEILKKIHEMKNGVIGDKKIVMHTGVGTTVSTVSITGDILSG